MKRKIGFYSIVLTSIVCMLGMSGSAFSAVRMLGNNNNSNSGTTASAPSTTSTSGTTASTRGSSLRFTPMVTTKAGSSSQPYSGLSTGSSTSGVSTNPSSARLSIGKYLNLSHTTPTTPSGGGSGSSTVVINGDDWSSAIEQLNSRIDAINTSKQNSLVVSEGDYIEITGNDQNVISINIEKLQDDLHLALGTDKKILTEYDETNYKLWWCYAEDEQTECGTTKHLLVDLGSILTNYDLATRNLSVNSALATKQVKLSDDGHGFIQLTESDTGNTETIGINIETLKTALNIPDAQVDIEMRVADQLLQWRYVDSDTWTTVYDLSSLLENSDYVTENVLETALAGMQKELVAGYGITLTDTADNKQQISVSVEALGSGRTSELRVNDDNELQWRYLDESNTVGGGWRNLDLASVIEININEALEELYPTDKGLYLLSVDNGGDHDWQTVQIVDEYGTVH